MNATILMEHEPTQNPGEHHVRALIRVEGLAPAERRRVPLNLSLILDRSGSMAGPKLEAAKHAARLAVGRLWPDDILSVVAYDDETRTVADPLPRSEHHALATQLQAIHTGGCTNLSAGWLLGRRHIEARRSPGRSNRIILLTDGLANAGITDHDQLASLLRAARDQGVTTTTIGFGSDFDEKLLRILADAGGGNAHYIEEPDQAPGIFEAELEELLGLSAQNLSAELKLEAGTDLAAVHHSYPRVAIEGGVRLEMGDLYASEPKLLLIEMVAREGAEARTSIPLATLTLFGDLLTPEGGMERRTVALSLTFSPAEGAVTHAELRRELVFLQAGAAREAALRAEAEGRVQEGAQHLLGAAYMVREFAGDDARATDEAQDLESMASRMVDMGLDASDQKYMGQRAHNLSRAKSTGWKRVSRERRGPNAPPQGQGHGA